ncbi:hypothetical protein [Haloarcula onubensis]|uniref:Uncharacterized protein n=1 Tax=Haloarcula onubensis TaxID=2950539 RepID=A0ABU2FQX8_9EURY|nr:hypothetical protein [Halomicroarcula sp. S3CR25-11]MDS0283173.1 hypothetical protein [Halomicroarcula sp. S3CR25-11]
MRETLTSFDPDVPYRLRQWVDPWLTGLARRVGSPEYRLLRAGYVGTVERPVDELASALRAAGFSWGPVSWYHHPPVGAEPNGSWTYRAAPLADRQLHVILTAHAPACVDVFAHWEYNWLRHPVRHAKQLDIDRETGVATMREWLTQRDIDFEERSRAHRKVRRTAQRVATALTARFGLGQSS